MQVKETQDCLDFFVKRCKEHGLKITPQRCAIYKEIFGADDHPSAEDVFKSVHIEYPNISYDTVNRTLLTFATVGLVDIVKGQSGPRRFDPNTDSHHHIYCVNCGDISDFYNEDYDNLEIPQDIQQKYDIISKRVVLKGVCKKCKKASFNLRIKI
jgi:Fur family peroxide stress response transcriptional regulator